MSRQISTVTAWIMATLLAANGLAMLLAPEVWYWTVPGVSDRGPFNHHFVRDIGMANLLLGGCFAAGVGVARHRLVLWAVPTLWLAGHALFHLWEVGAGHVHTGALLEDFGGVMLPALISVALCISARSAAGRSVPGQP
mgnify:FL=1